jgi:hypothetical protein
MQKMNEYYAPGAAASGTMCATRTTTLRSAATLRLILLMAGATVSVECFAQYAGHDGNTISVLQSDNMRTVLSFETGTQKNHTKLGGLAGAKAYVEIPGKQAGVRLRQELPQIFLMAIQDTLPASSTDGVATTRWATLYKLEVDKQNREVPQLNMTGYSIIGKTKMQDPRGIPLNFSRYDDHTVKIEPRVRLAAGEYAFFSNMGKTDPYAPLNQSSYYCFGID